MLHNLIVYQFILETVRDKMSVRIQITSFPLVLTLSVVMAVILRYFTHNGRLKGQLRHSG